MADDHAHIRKLIQDVLFTHGGERVEQPDFGIDLHQYMFEPNTRKLRMRIEQNIQAHLNKWLSDEIEVEQVEVEPGDLSVTLTVQYIIRKTKERRRDGFFHDYS